MFSPRELASNLLLAAPKRSAILRYGCAFASVALALVATRSIVDVERAPYFIFFNFAVILTAFYAGWRPAFLAIGLSTMTHYLVFTPPYFTLDVNEPHDLLRMGFFIALTALIAGCVELLRSSLLQLHSARIKIAEQAEQYRVTLASIGDAVIAIDVGEQVQFMNSVAETLTGWNFEEAAGKHLQDIFNVMSELTRKPLGKPLFQALCSGTIVDVETHILLVGKDRAERPVDSCVGPICDVSGKVIGTVLVFRDISKRREDEREKEELLAREKSAKQKLQEAFEALRKSEVRFRTIVESNMIAVCFWDGDGIAVDVNDGFLRLVGYTRGDLASAKIDRRKLTPKEYWKFDDDALRQMKTGRSCSPYEKEYIRKDGTRVPVLVSAALLGPSDGQVVSCLIDLSERKLVEKLTEEKLYLEDEIQTQYNFKEIVGQSSVLMGALREVETVAPTDSTALILGESGTGKELMARAIHDRSSRRDRTFVKLSCAAIPAGLLESELFGFEKGAFTGAIASKVGRLELAHKGTLFLDEVGDLPLELQPKLLRVLQEKQFERLGSTRTISVDIRLIAATNRNLNQMMKDREFREDLYYRLNVFPIRVPPLRDRSEDIPLLVRYFVQKHAKKIGRKIETILGEDMQALSRWQWPGNVRELENFLERAVILSSGPVLRMPLSELKAEKRTEGQLGSAITLDETEREAILRAVREAGGRVAGPGGAAARLGLKRSTLNSKMRRLGITRTDVWTTESTL